MLHALRLGRLLALALFVAAPAVAQSVSVTFRFLPDLTAPAIPDAVRAFLPGSMNGWGPNTNGQIAIGAPSAMTYRADLNEHRYTVSLTAGQSYAYKVHYHTNTSGTSYVWLTDPLGTETTGPNNDSVIRVADPMAFQIAREEDAGGQVVAVSAGLFGTQAFTSVAFTVNETTYATGAVDTGNGVWRLVLPAPVVRGSFVRVTATDAGGRTVTSSVGVIPPVVVDAPRPTVGGRPVPDGITRLADGGLVLSLWAPGKGYVHAIGSFNNWTANDASLMRRDAASADSTWWWIRLDGIDPAQPMLFQYLIEGQQRVVDPYVPLILDPSNDPSIPAATFPGRPAYPAGQTGVVGVHWPARFDYAWQTTGYQRPAQADLVIYELLVRDFLAAHNFQALADTLDYLDRLGVNAVELMPVSEFGGNLNWGYQPTFHLALDKYYGPPEALKRFVDLAHARGIAVLLDVVYNHADGPSPLVNLYGCTEGSPYTNNPARHEFNVFCDLDHTNPQTRTWLDRANAFWLREYRIDGYRFDLTGGFMQTGAFFPGNGNLNPERVANLTRMANRIWDVDPTAYVIFEHLVESQTEYRALAQIGRAQGRPGPMLWNNMNRPYSELAMGYPADPDANGLARSYPPVFFGASADRSYVSSAVTYMESHDEQWLMRRNLAFGNQNGGYSTRTLATALDRIKQVASFFLTVPGPRMMWQFGEVGYGFGANECLPEEGLTCGVGRTDSKPIRWEYASDPQRRNLYLTYAALNRLRADYDLFRSPATDVVFGGTGQPVRTLRLSLPGAPGGEPAEALVFGNFGVTPTTATLTFAQAGTWYDFFSDTQVSVPAGTQSFTLQPGETRIWTDVDVPSPPPGIFVVADASSPAGPPSFALGTPFPNPARDLVAVDFALGASGPVRLEVFDVLGRRVATLVDGPLGAGAHDAAWATAAVPAGVYVLRLSADGQTATTRVTVAR